VFEFSGSGSITGGGSININGYFYLTSTTTSRTNPTNVYGIYRMTGAIGETGVLTGALNPSSGTISFTMTSQNGNKYTLKANKTDSPNPNELVSNGAFNNNINGWTVYTPGLFETWEWQSGALHAVNTTSRGLGGGSSFNVIAGKSYRIRMNLTINSGTIDNIGLNQYQWSVQRLTIAGGVTASTNVDVVYNCQQTESVHIIFDTYNPVNFTVDNVSVQEVP
jgi:hypothetical protein